MPDEMKISIDLGSTNIKAAVVDGGECLRRLSEPCKADGPESEVMGQIENLIKGLMSPEIEGIGIGVPSVVDPERGVVYDVMNIPSWKEVHLKRHLEEIFHLPVAIDNDCNCFVLGETRYGAARGSRNVVGMTLGTGVGAGLVIDGRLYGGLCNGAGEIGCLPYLDSDYEHYCSSQFFSRRYSTTAAELAERADAGDAEAKRIWNEFGTHLGKLVCAAMYAYSPEIVVIGGGIAAAWEHFQKAMMEKARAFPYRRIAEEVKITKAMLPNAGLIGASLL